MTLIINDSTDKEEVTRETQLGVRFPDGSIVWGRRDDRHRYVASYNGADFLLDRGYDGRSGYNNFVTLEERYLSKLKDAKLPTDESSLLERVSREVVILFGKVTVMS